MRTGRLSISRGHELHEAGPVAAPRLAIVPAADPPEAAVPIEPPPAPSSVDYHLVHDRLTALERLTRLLELGALSAEEFAAEKAVVLALPAEELVLRDITPAPVRPPRGPSLLGRMFTWKFLPVGLVCGLGLSFYAQPDETIRLFDQTLRLLGA